jgi:hypothetical protein
VYSLFDPKAGNTDGFGQEAIDTLVGCITDQRNAATVVVVAGYKDRMDRFFTANQGLASRFGTEIEFPDYTDDECVQILHKLMDNEGLICPKTEGFQRQLVRLFAGTRQQMGHHFGNARTVGGVFNQIMERLDVRVHQLDNPTDQDLLTILPEDIPGYQKNNIKRG